MISTRLRLSISTLFSPPPIAGKRVSRCSALLYGRVHRQTASDASGFRGRAGGTRNSFHYTRSTSATLLETNLVAWLDCFTSMGFGERQDEAIRKVPNHQEKTWGPGTTSWYPHLSTELGSKPETAEGGEESSRIL